MANQFSTGAVLLYVGLSPSSSPLFLGTCEGHPRMEVAGEYGTVVTDLSGPNVPLDFSFGGESATISFNLTRWNNVVAAAMERRPGPSSANPPGAYTMADMGSLMAMEGWALSLWIRYVFGSGASAKAVYTALGLPGGYRFPLCNFGGPWGWESGAKPAKRQFIFNAWPRITVNATNPVFTLYDNDMSAVIGIPIT